MAGAWIYQKLEDVYKLGEAAAPYYVGWYEPAGFARTIVKPWLEALKLLGSTKAPVHIG
jgi:hypothetical protein